MDTIAWLGSIYSKFESMCLEVDEIMQEEGLTYVESQLQTVGANVKQFCSEMVEDLLLNIGTEGDAPCKSTLVHNTDEADEVSREATVEDQSDKESINASGLLLSCSVEPIKVTQLDLSLKGTVDAVMSEKSVVGDDEIHFKEKQLQLLTADKMIPNEIDSSMPLSVNSDILGSNTSTSAIPMDAPSSNSLTMGEFCEHEVLDADAELTLSDFLANLSSDTVKNPPMDLTELHVSGLNIPSDDWIELHDDYAKSKLISFPSNTGKPDPSVEDNTSLGSSYELKLDESCIMVDGSDLSPLISRQHGSFKKKLKLAFATKRKAGKQDQLEVLHGNLEMDSSEEEGEVVDIDSSQREEGFALSSITLDQEFCESDWEII